MTNFILSKKTPFFYMTNSYTNDTHSNRIHVSNSTTKH